MELGFSILLLRWVCPCQQQLCKAQSRRYVELWTYSKLP